MDVRAHGPVFNTGLFSDTFPSPPRSPCNSECAASPRNCDGAENVLRIVGEFQHRLLQTHRDQAAALDSIMELLACATSQDIADSRDCSACKSRRSLVEPPPLAAMDIARSTYIEVERTTSQAAVARHSSGRGRSRRRPSLLGEICRTMSAEPFSVPRHRSIPRPAAVVASVEPEPPFDSERPSEMGSPKSIGRSNNMCANKSSTRSQGFDRSVTSLDAIKGCFSEEIDADSDQPLPERERPSFCGEFRRDCGWSTISAFLVLLNAICIGVNCDVAPGWSGWLFIDTAFAAVFLVELIARMAVGGGWRLFVKDGDAAWNVMELLIVVVACAEVTLQWSAGKQPGSGFTAAFRTLRMLRVTRVARVLRLQMFQELTILIKGLLGGLRVLGWSLVLLMIPLYCSAVALHETAGKEDPVDPNSPRVADNFKDFGTSLFTMFRCTVAGDCVDAQGFPIFVQLTVEYGWGYAVIYALCIIFMTLGLFNVIAAIFVEQVIVGAKTSAVLMRRNRLRDKAFFAGKITELLKVVIETTERAAGRSDRELSVRDIFERAQTVQISRDLFHLFWEDPRFAEILNELDVPDEEQFHLFETLDASGESYISLEELVDGIARLRGDPKRSDIVHLLFTLKTLQANVRSLESCVGAGRLETSVRSRSGRDCSRRVTGTMCESEVGSARDMLKSKSHFDFSEKLDIDTFAV